MVSYKSEHVKRFGGKYEEAGWQGYRYDLAMVFDPEFDVHVEKTISAIARYKDDQYLLGYYTDNEQPWKNYKIMKQIESGYRRSTLFMLFMITILLSLASCKTTVKSIEQESSLIVAVNAYSFADLLSAKEPRDNDQVYTLFNLLDWCNANNIKAVDPTAYFFPTYPEVPSDEYIEKLKTRADELGIEFSGTGIRNHFASPDSLVRAQGVELAKQWIVVASKLGAPVIRVFAGAIPKGYEENWEEPAGWVIDCCKELLPYAMQYGVKIGIQNHGEMLQTAQQCLYVIKALDSEWAGLIIDTGNFTTDDPYIDIAQLVPYAVNWQVKEFTDGYGGDIRIDYLRLVKIIRDGGYKGYLPVETLKVRGEFYDPFQRVKNMIDALDEANSAVY